MITRIYEPFDEQSTQSAEWAQSLVESDAFMAGLGESCDQYPVPADFPQITDLERSIYLMTSQEMWDEPEETRQDQFFPEFQNGGVKDCPKYHSNRLA